MQRQVFRSLIAPRPIMKLRAYGNTDLGRVRHRNEDAWFIDTEAGLFAVADGLGGLAAGDRASELAISLVKAHLKESRGSSRPLDFTKLFADAHAAIQKLGAHLDPVRGSGTTLTVALVESEQVTLAHAGDSAAYLFGEETWRKLTTDHTEAETFRKRHPGQQVPALYEHTLTRCLGQPGTCEPDLFREKISPGDCLFLCTDGATRAIDPEEIAAWVREEADPQPLVEKVLKLAYWRGGSDNATAVAVCIDS